MATATQRVWCGTAERGRPLIDGRRVKARAVLHVGEELLLLAIDPRMDAVLLYIRPSTSHSVADPRKASPRVRPRPICFSPPGAYNAPLQTL